MEQRYQVTEGTVSECPVSMLVRNEGRATELVNQYFRAQRMGRHFGELMYGPDASQWPAWVEDAILVFEKSKMAADTARAIDMARRKATNTNNA